jgi:hypothetical protein
MECGILSPRLLCRAMRQVKQESFQRGARWAHGEWAHFQDLRLSGYPKLSSPPPPCSGALPPLLSAKIAFTRTVEEWVRRRAEGGGVRATDRAIGSLGQGPLIVCGLDPPYRQPGVAATEGKATSVSKKHQWIFVPTGTSLVAGPRPRAFGGENPGFASSTLQHYPKKDEGPRSGKSTVGPEDISRWDKPCTEEGEIMATEPSVGRRQRGGRCALESQSRREMSCLGRIAQDVISSDADLSRRFVNTLIG